MLPCPRLIARNYVIYDQANWAGRQADHGRPAINIYGSPIKLNNCRSFIYVRTRNTPERKGQREVIKQMPSNNFVVVPGKEFRHELRFLRVKMRRKVLSGVCTHTHLHTHTGS